MPATGVTARSDWRRSILLYGRGSGAGIARLMISRTAALGSSTLGERLPWGQVGWQAVTSTPKTDASVAIVRLDDETSAVLRVQQALQQALEDETDVAVGNEAMQREPGGWDVPAGSKRIGLSCLPLRRVTAAMLPPKRLADEGSSGDRGSLGRRFLRRVRQLLRSRAALRAPPYAIAANAIWDRHSAAGRQCPRLAGSACCSLKLPAPTWPRRCLTATGPRDGEDLTFGKLPA
jgi:hypothetical protein